MTEQTVEAVRAHIDRGRAAIRARVLVLYAAASVVLGIVFAISGTELYRQGPMVLVGLLAVSGAGFHLWYRRVSWSRHPVLIALERAPEDVEGAAVLGVHGRAALLNERSIVIRARHAELHLPMPVEALSGLRDALAAHCPRARLSGFPETD